MTHDPSATDSVTSPWNHPAIGIHDIAFATTSQVLDLAHVAARLDVPPAKYAVGLGQDRMSVPAQDEDIVTMAAEAAAKLLERHGSEGIRTLIFATETGIDQSKAAGVFVHGLLGLPGHVRTVELKQACYSATAGLQFAHSLVARNPRERVLVIASDIARYEIGSGAEATQGAGAVAMLVAADPALVEFEAASGVFTADVDDFWRPNFSQTAYVDGKLSVSAYIDAVVGAWEDYRAQGGADFADIDYFCYHQPFTKMVTKAHTKVVRHAAGDAELDPEQVLPTFRYSREIGNSYTASMYVGLAALLDSADDLAGKRLAFVSYGSGSVAEFFTGIVKDGYTEHVRKAENLQTLASRNELTDADYLDLVQREIEDPANYVNAHQSTGPFRFAGVTGALRRYEVR